MKETEIVILSDTTNAAVVKLPGRKFPGVVIQGDSLKIIYNRLEELRDNISGKKTTDVPIDLADELLDIIEGYLASYKNALKGQ